MSRTPSGAQRIGEAARELLDVLPPELRDKALRSFADEAGRRDWGYVPGERDGVYLGELDRAGRKAVHALVAAALRPHAYAQVATIMALEDVLDEIENRRRERHSSDYALALFGEPGEDSAWGWRFEGHHASLNMTMEDGRVISATPSFLGANPATIAYGGVPVIRPLALEEELARAFIESLDEGSRARAVVAEEAPADIRTRAQPRVEEAIEPLGIAAADLDDASMELLRRLVTYYIERLPDDLARDQTVVLDDAAFERMSFAWEGSVARSRPHYYRVQAPGLLIEYDNTQNDANHIHSVWRSPERDFGGDVLARHYRAHH